MQRHAKAVLRTTREACGWQIRVMVGMPDHVHPFISARPTDSPVAIVKMLEGSRAKVLFESHPYLRGTFRQGPRWSPGCYVGTLGHVSEETVKRCVEDQKLRTPGRPAGRPSSPQ